MNNVKGVSLLLSIFAVVFICGYRGESIGGLLHSLKSHLFNESIVDPESLAVKQQEIPAKKPLAPPVGAPKRQKPNEASQAAPFYQMLQKQRKNPSRPTAPAPRPTTQNLPKSQNWQGSMKETLNSINRDSIDDGQRLRRNDYFNKLSQQMEQMRGKKASESTEDAIDESSPEQAKNNNEEVIDENLEQLEVEDIDLNGANEDAVSIDELDEAIDELLLEPNAILE